ncbi:MAG: hypothetical protein WC162_00775 [Sphaerochaetaceae bacterium]|nr:hypothetical protein [Sphaerochaetaceae bacterium]
MDFLKKIFKSRKETSLKDPNEKALVVIPTKVEIKENPEESLIDKELMNLDFSINEIEIPEKKEGFFSFFTGINDTINDIFDKTKKITKTIKIIGKTVDSLSKNKELPEEIQNYIIITYKKLYDLLRGYIADQLKKMKRRSLENSIVNLGIFFIAIVFLTENNSLSILLASICLIITFSRFLYSIIKTLPSIFRFLSCWFKAGLKNLDEGISVYLKKTYQPLKIAEEYKSNYKFLSGIPGLPKMVKDYREGLRGEILNFFLTLIIAGVLLWVFRRLLLISATDLTFWQLLASPFTRILNLLKI